MARRKVAAMEGAGAHRHVVGLQDDAALVGPVALQRQDQVLKRPGAFGLRQAEIPRGKGAAV